MKIWIDREICQGNLTECLLCLIHAARTGAANNACIIACEPSNSKKITIFLHAERNNRAPLLVPKELVDMIAYEFREGVLAPKIEIEF